MVEYIRNLPEQKFASLCDSRAWTWYKRGWPDFLVETAKGPMVVEVKKHRPKVRPSQAAVLRILEKRGIPAFVWTPRTGFTRVTDGGLLIGEDTNPQPAAGPKMPEEADAEGILLGPQLEKHLRAMGYWQ